MRFGSNSRSVINYNNNFIGFDLGFDFCAEHE